MVVRFFTVFIDRIELSLLDEPGLIALVVQQAETEDRLRDFLEAVENLKGVLEVFLLLELAIREDLPIGVLQLLQDLFETWESDVDLETGVGDNDGVVEILLVVLLQNLLYLLEPGVCAQESDDSLGLGAVGLERNRELEVNAILGKDLFSPLLSIQLVRRSKYDEITEIMFDVGERIKALPERLNVLGKLLNYSGPWSKGN